MQSETQKSRAAADPIRLIMGKPTGHAMKSERLADGRVIVQTHKGLNPIDRLLIEGLAAVPYHHALTILTQTPLPALAAKALNPEAGATFLHMDLFRTQQASALVAAHNAGAVDVLCAPNLPTLEPAPNLIAATFSRDGEAGLACEMIHQAHARLAKDGKLLAATNNPHDRWLRAQLIKTFGNHLTLLLKDRRGLLYLVKKAGQPESGEPAQLDQFIKHIEVHLGDEQLVFQTCYGVFTSDALDDGSRALLELMEPPKRCETILDLGCGWGGMGILAARRAGAKRLTMIDANARAVQMAQLNAATHLGSTQVDLRLEANADSIDERGEAASYDMVITNPPYGTELRVADRFVEVAHAALRKAGVLWLVCKANPHINATIETLFGNVRELRRRGYSILTATKEA